jgi:formylglycine-generating enzyme required for sulfatase activity
LGGLGDDLVTFEVSANPQHVAPIGGARLEKTEWSGMSGAAVLAPDPHRPGRLFLIGVVAEHAPQRGAASISVLPLDRLFRTAARPPNAAEWWARLGVTNPTGLPALPPPPEAKPRYPFEPELVEIEGGKFWTGADDGEPFEGPRVEIVLPPFAISRCPITNAQFEDFVRETHMEVAPEMDWEIMSVGQATRTARAYRLPTEAEWEKAARGTEGRRYPWGDAFDTQRCNTVESGIGSTSRVGAYSPAGDSVNGCADMAGNVMEWTSTMWGTRRGEPRFRPPYRADDGRESPAPAEPFRELRICRGGSFRDSAARATGFARSVHAADDHDVSLGFRVAVDDDA